ncbi:MAG: hypothetical protein QOF32_427, partial [Gammaproteobacteria bacterium]|nr:hypothetical protein [Gammaproteobacteria bacterium]
GPKVSHAGLRPTAQFGQAGTLIGRRMAPLLCCNNLDVPPIDVGAHK